MDNFWDHLRDTVAYREIYSQGRDEGRQEGKLEMTLLQIQRCCGSLASDQQTRIRALSRTQLEDLSEALLDFQSAADLEAWLATG